MTQENTLNPLWIATFTMAEITRYKFGKEGMSLTHPVIERNARHKFAAMVGISARSSAKVFLSELKRVHADNDLSEKFAATLQRFGLDANNF